MAFGPTAFMANRAGEFSRVVVESGCGEEAGDERNSPHRGCPAVGEWALKGVRGDQRQGTKGGSVMGTGFPGTWESWQIVTKHDLESR